MFNYEYERVDVTCVHVAVITLQKAHEMIWTNYAYQANRTTTLLALQ